MSSGRRTRSQLEEGEVLQDQASAVSGSENDSDSSSEGPVQVGEELVTAIKQYTGNLDKLKKNTTQFKPVRAEQKKLREAIITQAVQALPADDEGKRRIGISDGTISIFMKSKPVKVDEGYTFNRLLKHFGGDESAAKAATDVIWKTREEDQAYTMSVSRKRAQANKRARKS